VLATTLKKLKPIAAVDWLEDEQTLA